MLISFDLDDTLICYDPQIPREANRVPFWWKLKPREPLRLGTVDLARQLQEDGHQLMIYTTSIRSPSEVRRWLGFYGFRAASVVNAASHSKIGDENARRYSKLPSSFGISLHVDDEDFCEMGAKFGFKWLMIAPRDLQWTEKVLQAVRDIEVQSR